MEHAASTAMEFNKWACEVCGFELRYPVSESEVTVLALYDDGRYPGRCLLARRKQVEHFDDLEPREAHLFVDEIIRYGRGLRTALAVPRVNYAILGNVEPHLHAHLIPRAGPGDPAFGKNP